MSLHGPCLSVIHEWICKEFQPLMSSWEVPSVLFSARLHSKQHESPPEIALALILWEDNCVVVHHNSDIHFWRFEINSGPAPSVKVHFWRVCVEGSLQICLSTGHHRNEILVLLRCVQSHVIVQAECETQAQVVPCRSKAKRMNCPIEESVTSGSQAIQLLL